MSFPLDTTNVGVIHTIDQAPLFTRIGRRIDGEAVLVC